MNPGRSLGIRHTCHSGRVAPDALSHLWKKQVDRRPMGMIVLEKRWDTVLARISAPSPVRDPLLSVAVKKHAHLHSHLVCGRSGQEVFAIKGKVPVGG